MENPQEIFYEMKLSQNFLDDDKNISYEFFYSKIVPLFIKNSNQENEININYNINNIIYNVKLVKINKIYFEIFLFENNTMVKKLEKVFIESINIKFNQENLEIANLDQFNQIRGIIQLKYPFLRCCFHDEILDYTIKDLIKHRLKKIIVAYVISKFSKIMIMMKDIILLKNFSIYLTISKKIIIFLNLL
jgi:hypothetical protein